MFYRNAINTLLVFYLTMKVHSYFKYFLSRLVFLCKLFTTVV